MNVDQTIDDDARMNATIELCARVCDAIGRAKVGQPEASGERDAHVYEQGIGAEQCAKMIRELKKQRP